MPHWQYHVALAQSRLVYREFTLPKPAGNRARIIVRNMKTHLRTILTFGVCFATMACGGGSRTSDTGGEGSPQAQVIAIDGSSTVFPVTEAVAEEFQKAIRHGSSPWI